MTNELYQSIDELRHCNTELSEYIQYTNAEVGKLKSKSDHPQEKHLVLKEKLQEANEEVFRLNLLLKNQVFHC